MQFAADAVSAETAHQVESAFLLNVFLNRLRPVNQWSLWLHRGNATAQAFLAALHQGARELVRLAKGVGPSGVTDPALVAHADINRKGRPCAPGRASWCAFHGPRTHSGSGMPDLGRAGDRARRSQGSNSSSQGP